MRDGRGASSLAIEELGKKDVGVKARTTRVVGMVEVRRWYR